MKLKNTSLIFIAALTVIFILSFASGCISEGHPDEQNEQLQTGENILSGSDQQNISSDSNSVNSDNNEVNTNYGDISVAETTGKINDKYTPLWKAGIMASDIDGKSYCLITKFLPETSEYYIMNVMYPPEGSPYIYKDSSFGGMGQKYQSDDIDKKYCVFVKKVIEIPVYAKGSSTSIAGYLKRNTSESMRINWTSK